MKLVRFTAATTQKAIVLVHESLGPNALIYSTRKMADGIEVLAGLPLNEEKQKQVKVEGASLDHKAIEKLKQQVQYMNETIQMLSENIGTMHQLFVDKFYKKKIRKWNFFKNLASKFKFRVGHYGQSAVAKK